jgi:hypothetical protein
MKTLRNTLILFGSASLFACGGDGSSFSDTPPLPPVTATYTVSVTAIDVVATDTDDPVAIDNLPIEGATLTD